MDGYFGKPELSAAALTPDGWYRTGDWCREDEDGAIAVTGRIAETILSGGENVFPLEVENVIMTMTGIVEAAVAGAPDDVWGQAVTAFVVRSDRSISEADVVNACRRAWPDTRLRGAWSFSMSCPRMPLARSRSASSSAP
jgi:acyl-CoA synthetase (AMP-forming)/AMP-acid ligase II